MTNQKFARFFQTDFPAFFRSEKPAKNDQGGGAPAPQSPREIGSQAKEAATCSKPLLENFVHLGVDTAGLFCIIPRVGQDGGGRIAGSDGMKAMEILESRTLNLGSCLAGRQAVSNFTLP
ncbi:MAG: hypothetical protein N2689_12440 [Verrucomicrobiae bacterium]|nr:hypothetical protein [Verrucomicrobiae bacterium]